MFTKYVKKFTRFNLGSALIGFIAAASVWMLVFQDINISKISILAWFILFFVFYSIVNFILDSDLEKKWNSIDIKLKLISILLILLMGSIFIKLTNFNIPEPLSILPKQHITIETSAKSNPLSSGHIIEIKGIKNGDEWVNLTTMDINGDFDLVNDSVIIDERPAILMWNFRVDNQLMFNFIARPDAGIINIINGEQIREIDLYSENITESPVILNFPVPMSITLITLLFFIISTGFFCCFIPILIIISILKKPVKDSDINSLIEPIGHLNGQPSKKGLVLVTVSQLFVLFFMEWLFQVTKPSFMLVYDLKKKINILLSSYSLVALIIFVVIFFVILIFSIGWRNKSTKRLYEILTLIPAFIQTITILLLVDNFFYTLFKVGVVTADVISRTMLLFLFLILFIVSFQNNINYIARVDLHLKKSGNVEIILFTFIALLCLATNFLGENTIKSYFGTYSSEGFHADELPNILYITSDGVNARNMSLYGYERDTTPRLLELSETSLLAENAFTNSGKSTGSILSVFTGKYPSEIRVLNPTEILQKDDADESLIKMLKDFGYFNVQIAVPHYIDAYEQNLQKGFDVVNGRTKSETILDSLFSQNTIYFINIIQKRITDRTNHIFFIEDMLNVADQVNSEENNYSDREKIDELISYIKNKDGPIFIHVHLMGTHGREGKFYPIEQIFSKGQDPELQGKWNTDFFDDSIHDFDYFMGLIYEELIRENKLDNSILIIGSDHGQDWTTVERIPLLIRFPNGDYSGVIQRNVQNIDIAPTILDYLKIDIPEWMEGNSLIENMDSSTQLPIFSFSSYRRFINQIDSHPPFYQFCLIYVVQCQNWYELDLNKLIFSTGLVEEYQHPCSSENQISAEQALNLMISHLQDNGFDTSSISNSVKQ